MHKKINLIIYVCLLKSKDYEDRNVPVIFPLSVTSYIVLVAWVCGFLFVCWFFGFWVFFTFFSPIKFQFYTLSVFLFLGVLILKYRCFPLLFLYYHFYDRHFSNYSICHFHPFHFEIKYKILLPYIVPIHIYIELLIFSYSPASDENVLIMF